MAPNTKEMICFLVDGVILIVSQVATSMTELISFFQ